MSKKINSNKIGSWILLLIIGSFLILGLLGTTDVIIHKTLSISDSVKIQKFYKNTENKYFIQFSYFNEFKLRNYLINKTIEKSSFEKLQNQKIINISYVSYFPYSPLVENIDSKHSIFLLLTGLVLIFVSFYRTLLVVFGKLEVSELFGSKKLKN